MPRRTISGAILEALMNRPELVIGWDRPRNIFYGEKPVWVEHRIWTALDGKRWEAVRMQDSQGQWRQMWGSL